MTSFDSKNLFSPLKIPPSSAKQVQWGSLIGASQTLVIATHLIQKRSPLLIITPDSAIAKQVKEELRFFLTGYDIPLLPFPDWETLPYDLFSPHQDIVSQRLSTLYRLWGLTQGAVIVPVMTLMQRLPPKEYLTTSSLLLQCGDPFNVTAMRKHLERSGYTCVSQVMERGEFSVRGSLLDIFPMGSHDPYRIEVSDTTVESIRTFDPENQLTIAKIEKIDLLPAREFPVNEISVARFKQQYRENFPQPESQQSPVFREVSQGHLPGGVDYYLPLFFETTHTLFDYLPETTVIMTIEEMDEGASEYWQAIHERYEQRCYDVFRPILPPEQLFLTLKELDEQIHRYPNIALRASSEAPWLAKTSHCRFDTEPLPELAVKLRTPDPLGDLNHFFRHYEGRTLLVANSPGRQEAIKDFLHQIGVRVTPCPDWPTFYQGTMPVGITQGKLHHGVALPTERLALITDQQILGERAPQRESKAKLAPVEQMIYNLAELAIGSLVVHQQHGIGRYLGLQRLNVGEVESEFLALEYAGGGKLYVPVALLHLVTRYLGAGEDEVALHKLGGTEWKRVRAKAAEKIRDTAAELLEIHAKRAAAPGRQYSIPKKEYQRFAAAFPFEPTPDQQRAIESVFADLATPRPMDRVICGDVGFGKTEVAVRASFVAVHNSYQVAILAPTTLLAQQHLQTFRDRFAGWPVTIEALSRFETRSQQNACLAQLEEGKLDIVIGTHRLLQKDVAFKNLGLVIIDEEHRFGVRQKERFKTFRSEVDLLTLTATPIPRTLNMSLSGLRDLSIIATPPEKRLAIKTFISEWDDQLIREACWRELKRGGQIYVVHNDIGTMDRMLEQIQAIVPNARVQYAHGQMRESDLEQTMLDFYHHRFNVLVCTTIIESGIDVPNANTMIIHRADRFGLAQLHQLRGRVGRSHHRAYAYLIAPHRKALPPDAVKRLDAIAALGDLGIGFTLATHDLEIRGAGELLGEGQSGQIQEIGFSLYTELMERAVQAFKSGKIPNLEESSEQRTEIDLKISALIPEDYLPDAHQRLILYKRIANAKNNEELRNLQMEMIDRFGLLPETVKNLFAIAELRIQASALGVLKIEGGATGGRITFKENPAVDPAKIIRLLQKHPKQFALDGQDKLRFLSNHHTPQERLNYIETLLKTIQ